MRYTFTIAAALLGVAMAAPQGVHGSISPEGSTPEGCSTSYNGPFEITVATVTGKRSLQKRAECGANGILVMTLEGGVTKDSLDRTGYIASNYQFQFDKPAQAGAIYTSGFSLCDNNVLALGSNKTFYRCLSGTFYNLYSQNWAEQCEEVSIIALPCGSDDTAGQLGDGQVVGTTVIQTTIITALSDGQPQVITTSVSVPVTSYYPTTTAVPVSQYTDGQIQVTPPGSEAPPPAATSTPEGTVVLPTESVPVTGAPTGSPSASESSTAPASSSAETSVGTTPAASSPSAPATTSPASSGSDRVVAGSAGTLVVALFAFACL